MEDVKKVMDIIIEEFEKICINENTSNAKDFLEEIIDAIKDFLEKY